MLGMFIPGANVLAAAGTALSLFLRFVTSTVGMVVIALLAGYIVGHHQAVKSCNAAALRAKIATMQADVKNAKTAAFLAENQNAALEASDRANKEKVNALESDLAKRVDRKCGLSRNDARKLRGIN